MLICKGSLLFISPTPFLKRPHPSTRSPILLLRRSHLFSRNPISFVPRRPHLLSRILPRLPGGPASSSPSLNQVVVDPRSKLRSCVAEVTHSQILLAQDSVQPPSPILNGKLGPIGPKGAGGLGVETMVKPAGQTEEMTSRGWDPEIGRTRVKDHCEVLRRRSQTNVSEILGIHELGQGHKDGLVTIGGGPWRLCWLFPSTQRA